MNSFCKLQESCQDCVSVPFATARNSSLQLVTLYTFLPNILDAEYQLHEGFRVGENYVRWNYVKRLFPVGFVLHIDNVDVKVRQPLSKSQNIERVSYVL